MLYHVFFKWSENKIKTQKLSLPEYSGGGSVANIQTDSEATLEDLHGEVLPLAGVEKDPVLLVSLHGEAQVDRGRGVERLKLHVGGGVDQLDCHQVLTSLT